MAGQQSRPWPLKLSCDGFTVWADPTTTRSGQVDPERVSVEATLKGRPRLQAALTVDQMQCLRLILTAAISQHATRR